MKKVILGAVFTTVIAFNGSVFAVNEAAIRSIGDDINSALAASGQHFRLGVVEYVTAVGSDSAGGKVIIFKDTGNKQLIYQWVKGDPRRGGFTDIAYLTDNVDGSANDGNGGVISAIDTTAAIDEGMNEWNMIDCSYIPIFNLGTTNIDVGYVQFLVGFGGFPIPLFDITHAGWLPGAFFDAIAGPGGADNILGVTFSFWFVDENGDPTDIDGDGKRDTALAEIYMNNNFAWEFGNDEGVGFYDIRAVMFHEQGHALSQAHFGEISINPKGKVIISPAGGRNLMLAAVSSRWEWEGFHGNDIGGHCSIWADW